MRLPKFFLLAMSVVILGACAAAGPANEPVKRTLTWFSYLNGDDLRTSCKAGVPDQYRFVYNGLWNQQVRAYELITERPLAGSQTLAAAPGAVLASRVFSAANIASAYLDALTGQNAGTASRVMLRAADLENFRAKLATSGFRRPPEKGAWLRSDRFYWVGMGCENGEFQYQAWQIDEARPDVDRPAFIDALLAFDDTGVAMAQPHPVDNTPFDSARARKELHRTVFRLQLDANGVRQ